MYVPDTSYYASLISYLDSISATHRIIVLSDFNSLDTCWSTHHGHSSPSKSLCDLLFRHNLSQMVEFSTNINGNTLDLVISSPEVHISDLKILSSLLRSDHYMLGFTSPLLARRRADSSFSCVSLNCKKAICHLSCWITTSTLTTNPLTLSFSGTISSTLFSHLSLFTL